MPDEFAGKKPEVLQQGSSKTLFLIRHAKSSWESGIPSDFERPLNDRGKRDAPIMAGRLKEKHFVPDAFVSSPAKRAISTANVFCTVFTVDQQEIISVPSLYHAEPQTFFEVVAALDDKITTVAIFSHNPGITAFANLLTKNIHIDNMPTCGIFGVQVFTEKWVNFEDARKAFLLFDYPKNN